MTVLNKFASLRATHDLAIRLSVFYAATFMIVGSYMSFLPLWLKSKGLGETQIALIYAMPVLLRPLFTTLISFFADRSGRHVWLLKLLAVGTLASVLVLPGAESFALIFAGFTAYALFWTTVIPLTEAVTLSAARRGAVEYGHVRLWGSLSYIAVTLAGGVAVDALGTEAALWMFIGSAVCVLAASQFLPGTAALNGGASPASLRKIRFADLGALLRLPSMWLFLAATSAIQATHAVYYLFGTIHWTSIGISPTVIGMLWVSGVIAEIVLFAYGARVMRRVPPVTLIIIGGLAAVLRWTVTSLDPPLGVLFAAQIMHSVTFGVTSLGAIAFMTRAFPDYLSATVQGLYASFSAGVAMGSAYLAAGPLYRAFGASAYLSMAVLGAVAAVLATMLARRWEGGLILQPQSAGEGGRMNAPT